MPEKIHKKLLTFLPESVYLVTDKQIKNSFQDEGVAVMRRFFDSKIAKMQELCYKIANQVRNEERERGYEIKGYQIHSTGN